MTWTNIATIQMSKDWQFTDPIEGRIFRFRHSAYPMSFYRGLICQAFYGEITTELLEVRKLWAKGEHDLYEFQRPETLVNRRIGVRRTDEYINPWSVDIDVLEEEEPPMIPVGSVMEFAGNVAPTTWLICDGSSISRTTYAQLFNIIGTAHGAGDGTNTFNLPDRRGRVGVGAGAALGLTNRTLGSKFGSENKVLSWGNLPLPNDVTSFVVRTNGATGYALSTSAGTGTRNLIVSPSDPQTPLDIVQPSIAMNYIIKALP